MIDTNVLVSALNSKQGASFRLLSMVGQNKFDFAISVPLVLEYEELCVRNKELLGLSEEDIRKVLDYLCTVGHPTKIFFLWRPFLKDFHDDMILELAMAGGCDSIITYNSRDFAMVEKTFGIHVITPKQFLYEIGEIPHGNH